MRKALAAVAALVLLATAAPAANVPLLNIQQSGCNEASQLANCLQQTIQSVNGNAPGLLGAAVNASTTSTAQQTLGSVLVPGASAIVSSGVFGLPGQGVHARCWGHGTNSGTNTLTVSIGTLNAFNVSGAATTTGVFLIDMTAVEASGSTQTVYTIGNFNTTFTTPTVSTAALSQLQPVTVACLGTSTTSGQIGLDGFTVEQIR